jgi:hypothetical protein
MGAMRQWESVSLKGNVLLKRICPQNGCVNVERKERRISKRGNRWGKQKQSRRKERTCEKEALKRKVISFVDYDWIPYNF